MKCDMHGKQWLNYIKQMIPVAVRYNLVPTKSDKRTYKLNLTTCNHVFL